MKKISYFIILLCMFTSCGGNDFSFNKEQQSFEANSTYFGVIEIRGIDNEDCYVIDRKLGGRKIRSINLKQIPKDFYIISCDGDTIDGFKLKKNSEYEIINGGVYDAPRYKIFIITDEKGMLYERRL
ncbi:MAG: hypothetical protein KBA86_01635 [Bacteroidales bacterium]|nr:hypothetical protein [Bacteroidales bacterium]